MSIYFADSITTDLTTDLAQMPGAFVIGRGTARRLEIRCRKGR
jgi:TolB-like protein